MSRGLVVVGWVQQLYGCYGPRLCGSRGRLVVRSPVHTPYTGTYSGVYICCVGDGRGLCEARNLSQTPDIQCVEGSSGTIKGPKH